MATKRTKSKTKAKQYKGRKVRKGPRGGKYILVKGKKRYL